MVVILVFGIPGSGKTTYAQNFRSYCLSKSISCTLISYDDVSKDKVWNDGSFHEYRESALKTIARSLPDKTSPAQPTHTLSVTIVDDIMHLRSMRREVYVLARDHGVPIITVWVNTDIETALARNALRTGRKRIDEDAIRRIHATLQPPDSVHIFDRHSFTVDGNSPDTLMSSMNDIVELAGQLWDNAVVSATVDKLPPAQIVPDNSPASCESVVKDLDLALRAIVAEGMAVNKQHNEVDNKLLGKAFVAAKAEILHTAKLQVRTSSEEGSKTASIRQYCLQFVMIARQSLVSAEHTPQGIFDHLVEFVKNNHL